MLRQGLPAPGQEPAQDRTHPHADSRDNFRRSLRKLYWRQMSAGLSRGSVARHEGLHHCFGRARPKPSITLRKQSLRRQRAANDHCHTRQHFARCFGDRLRRSRREFRILGLGAFDQLFDSLRITFGVAMTGDRVRASGRFDQNLRPNYSRLDVHRCDLRYTHTHLVHAEKTPFSACHRLFIDNDVSWEEEVAFGPPAGLKCFGWHRIAICPHKVSPITRCGQACLKFGAHAHHCSIRPQRFYLLPSAR